MAPSNIDFGCKLRLLANDMIVHRASTSNLARAYSRYGYRYAYRAETV